MEFEKEEYFVWVSESGEASALHTQANSAASAAAEYAEYSNYLRNKRGKPALAETMIAVQETASDNVSLFSVAIDEGGRYIATPEQRMLKFTECANYSGELQAKEECGRFYWGVTTDYGEIEWSVITPELWAALKKYHDDTAAHRAK